MKKIIFNVFLSAGVALAMLFSIPSFAAHPDDIGADGLKRRGDGSIDDSLPGMMGQNDDDRQGDRHGEDDNGGMRQDDGDRHSGRGRGRGRGRGGRDDGTVSQDDHRGRGRGHGRGRDHDRMEDRVADRGRDDGRDHDRNDDRGSDRNRDRSDDRGGRHGGRDDHS